MSNSDLPLSGRKAFGKASPAAKAHPAKVHPAKTDSGPAVLSPSPADRAALEKMAQTEALVAAMPYHHRRELWERIESGVYPEWELAFQIFTKEQAAQYSFDILDATKLIPEELVPLTPVGRMVRNRNPDNFFAETKQVAFCTAHVVPGIDFSSDPLLAGRIHSYIDTQISRLDGPNFHEFPIYAPSLSLMAQPGDGSIRGRKIAMLVAARVDAESIYQVHAALTAQGAVPRLVGPHIGGVKSASGETLQADASMENEPGFLFDALVLPDGQQGVEALAGVGHTMDFIKDQYRHCKTILVLGASKTLIDKAGITGKLQGGKPDAGLVIAAAGDAKAAVNAFIKGMAKHCHPERETDPSFV